MARSRQKSKVNKDAWLNTYADMITLILVFFILLFSMSSLDQEKYKLLVKAFTADPQTLEQISLEESDIKAGNPDVAPGGKEGEQIEDIKDLDDLYEYLKAYVETNNLQKSVQVERGENIVFVRFMSTLFFEADRAVLKEGGKEILDFVGQALRNVEPNIKYIRIDGHTAEAAPGTSTVDNRELSTDRANAVLKYFEDRYIQNPAKLMAVGYGMFRPVAPNDSEVNRAKNRRVEILVAKEDNLQEELDKIYELSDEIKDE
ncbi:flagellar motor protein MotB [Sinanaerobacter chloroacetimidivorans]|jgi:chemotaxis protein MotB|uniref:OmpA family protein n=1 Tax=Sinanaerobacter chloroacetimidivorans TaxID=2818044 RepID=A0A8J7VYR5_9FIRM|nr:flagellar motor protein MotB [Sinanaerobacter chloroacetimidivorans]MBR0597539.1 OmpA family protein [Sinanaerobacter chloroacetimidivorans]